MIGKYLPGLVLVSVFLGACDATRDAGYSVRSDIAFGALPKNRLDLYQPAEISDDDPVLVFFYGGGWTGGSRLDINVVGESFAPKGVIVVAPDYRLAREARFPAIAEDCAKAVAWAWRTQTRSDGSSRPLFVAGHSAGATNAALVALDHRYLAAEGVPEHAVTGFIGLAGPYVDLTRTSAYVFPESGQARFEPVEAVSAGDPPLLLIHSDADAVIPVENLSSLAAAAQAAGVEVTTLTPPDRGHVDVFYDMLEPANPVRKAVDAFIARHTMPPA
jgi:acetyl esterase/lipase